MEDEPVHTQQLFTTIFPELTKIVIDKQEVILSHFPLEEWENMDRGSWMLHGHSHHTKDYTDLNMYAKRMDVGMDWEEFRPYNWDEIKEIMKERKIKKRYE
jgi:calcineurin-like phosphoesterase family protein